MIMGIKTKIKKYLLLKLTGQIDFGTLIKRGLKVGTNFSMQKECIIDDSHCSLITIGNNVTLAPRVHILAHDSSTKMFLGYTKIGKVTIEDKGKKAWCGCKHSLNKPFCDGTHKTLI